MNFLRGGTLDTGGTLGNPERNDHTIRNGITDVRRGNTARHPAVRRRSVRSVPRRYAHRHGVIAPENGSRAAVAVRLTASRSTVLAGVIITRARPVASLWSKLVSKLA